MRPETPRIVERLHRIMQSALSGVERSLRPRGGTWARRRARTWMPPDGVGSTVFGGGQWSRQPVSSAGFGEPQPRDERTRTHLDAASQITSVIYELLDAHTDTAQLAAGLADDPVWDAHLDYLRALQRKGREALAGIAVRETA